MSCNKCVDQSEAAMRAAGVPARQTQAAWAQGDAASPHCPPVATGRCSTWGQCPRCGAFLTRQGQCLNARCDQDVAASIEELITLSSDFLAYQNATTCETCCTARRAESACMFCFFHDGQIPAFLLPANSRWMVGDKERVTAGELAQAFAGPGDQGRLAVLNRFPGLISRLGEDAKQALWAEVQRHPDKALSFYVPAALVEAGGTEYLVQAARREPAALRESLDALNAARQLHLEGVEITEDAIARRLAGRRDASTSSVSAEAKVVDDAAAASTEDQAGIVTREMRDSFKAHSAPITRARANKTLSVKMNYGDTGPIQGIMTRREFVERAYEFGWEGERVKIRKSKFWSIGNTEATKTEVDYLKHLQSFDKRGHEPGSAE